MDFNVIIDNLPFLMKGLFTSFQLAFFTIVLSLSLACLIAIGRISNKKYVIEMPCCEKKIHSECLAKCLVNKNACPYCRCEGEDICKKYEKKKIIKDILSNIIINVVDY